MESIQDKIKRRRKELNLSLEDVAKALGVNKSTVLRYESKSIEKMPIDVIPPLAKILQCTPEDLMGWEESEKKNNSQWGNDAANREYLKDKPELLEIYDQIVNRDDMVILFDKTKDLEPKDVESVLMFVQTIRKQRGLDD